MRMLAHFIKELERIDLDIVRSGEQLKLALMRQNKYWQNLRRVRVG